MLLDGLWKIGENYLHVQRWKPNFRPDKKEISSMPVWVRFPILPVEYYKEGWLRRAGNSIGKTIKVDIATLLASRGKFARVCVEVDLRKPLMSGYTLRGEFWRLQYEGLHEICFECGKYGHHSASCPMKEEFLNGGNKPNVNAPVRASRGCPEKTNEKASNSKYGEWISVQKSNRRRAKTAKGTMGNSDGGTTGDSISNNQGVSQ